jgi:hypothetical protein
MVINKDGEEDKCSGESTKAIFCRIARTAKFLLTPNKDSTI